MKLVIRFVVGMLGIGTSVAFGIVLTLIIGCAGQKPLQPGRAMAKGVVGPQAPGSMPELTVVQPENPAAPTTQTASTTEETSFVVPPGADVLQRQATVDEMGKTNVVDLRFRTTEAMPVKISRTSTTDQRVGEAQKDLASEVGAKLRAARPVQMIGVLMILGAVAMFHPAVRAIVASKTVQGVTAACGLALVVLPMVVVGNEKFILILAAVPAAWWIVHKNASKSTEVRLLREFKDANGDGRDDATGKTKAESDSS